MNTGLDPLAHAKDTLVDLAVRFGPKVLVAADYGAIAGELNVSLVEEFRRRGIGIAYPQREVRLIGGDE